MRKVATMADTHGFEVVAEVTEATLQEFLRSAWDNGGTDEEGSFPHEVEIPGETSILGYTIQSGQAGIERASLTLEMAPSVNGVKVEFDSSVQINLDPDGLPVPSLQLIESDFHASITAPFGTIPGSEPNVGVIFSGLSSSSVVITLAYDPIAPITGSLVEEYMHELYKKDVETLFPHKVTVEDYSTLGMTFDVFMEFFSDPDTLVNKVTAAFPDAAHVKISMPLHVKLYDIESGMPVFSPMGITARLVVNAPYQFTGGKVDVDMLSASLSVNDIQPGPDIEGTNYTINKAGAATFGLDIDAMVTDAIIQVGGPFLQRIGRIEVDVPTKDAVEGIVAGFVFQNLLERKYFGVWTPNMPENSPVSLSDVCPKALSHALAIAINSGSGAHSNALTYFIPGGSKFAIALDGALVEALIEKIVDKPQDEGGLGGIPCHFDDIEGHAVDLTALGWALQEGKIHFTGQATVHDVFCGANADISFWTDVGLRWTSPDASGRQTLEPYVIDKDADLPWWAWLLAVLTFLAGIITGVISIVIVAVIEGVVEKIGGSTIEDQVANKLQTLGAWPQNLQGIGKVETHFDEAVGIDAGGLLFSGPLTATAQNALTIVYSSNAGGPYSGSVAMPVYFQPGYFDSVIEYQWQLGDGESASSANVQHTYTNNGLFVARLRTTVNQSGGASRHYHAAVRITNSHPLVNVVADSTVDEGTELNLTGLFEDDDYTDRHEAIWDFGDDSAPSKGAVIEGNLPPKAKGKTNARHAWGDNGDYVVRLEVKDEDGGVSIVRKKIHVVNVPPTVAIQKPVFAYPGVPITLVALFTDPGWLDTHEGTWRFGDSETGFRATVSEVNEAPFAYGIAYASHIYRKTGVYCCECSVTDDDWGKGSDAYCLHVVDLVNKDFENGFSDRLSGAVANGWEPYQTGMASDGVPAVADSGVVSATGPARFSADDFILGSGRRSQRISGTGTFRAGIYQTLKSNAGWDYEFTVWYHNDEASNGRCRLGIDPSGASNPRSKDIMWVEGYECGYWRPLVARASAKGERIAVFLEAVAVEEECNAFFDHVSFIPYPCTTDVPPRPTPQPAKERIQCVDWADVAEAHREKEPYSKNGFTFSAVRDEPLRIVNWGEPREGCKCAIPDSGLAVQLPSISSAVTCSVGFYAGEGLTLDVFAPDCTLVGTATADSTKKGEIVELKISAENIASATIRGGGNESVLVRMCVNAKVSVTGSDGETEPGKQPDTVATAAEAGEPVVNNREGVGRVTVNGG